MHLMADAVAGTGEADAVLFGDTADVAVVIRIFKAGLQGVVVDVGDRQLGTHTLGAHCLKLQIGHGAGCILGQGLVDAQADFRADRHIARNQMRLDDFLCYCVTHIFSLFW